MSLVGCHSVATQHVAVLYVTLQRLCSRLLAPGYLTYYTVVSVAFHTMIGLLVTLANSMQHP